uniref:EGF-like domain-containing protein n=1 Tax=Graphocephala atropunctata TaxID=36148 RepID=A0A1B6M7Q8_9HEMI
MDKVSSILTLWVVLLSCASDSSPTSYLVATKEEISIYNPDSSTSNIIFSLPIIAVDFRFSKQDFYFILNNEVLYSYYSLYSKSYSEPTSILKLALTPADLVVDWVKFRIYVSSTADGAIYEVTMSGSTSVKRVGVNNVRDLAIDPYERQLFFLSNGSLGSLDLRNSRTSTLSIGPLKSVVKMAVDHHEAIIYLLGQDDFGSWVLVGSDYTGSQHTELYRGPPLGRPTALDAFNSRVVWCSGDDCFELTSSDCGISPTTVKPCSIRKLLYKLRGQEIVDIKFYNFLVQTPSTELACSQLQCSHNCSVVSLYSVACRCPPGTAVDPGGNVCREKPPRAEVPFFDRLQEAVYQWVLELTAYFRTFILACSVLMLALLLSGLCVLARAQVSRTNYPRTRNYSYDLAEMSNYALQKRLNE